MKRMFVTLSIIFLLIIWAAVVLGQKIMPDHEVPKFDRMKRRMELREEMHRRMMNKLIHGIGPDQDLFKDMDQLLENSMSEMPSLGATNFETAWEESSEGRTLLVTPKDKEQQLDIDISNGAITIKGKFEKKTAHGISVSNFSNVFSVPSDCDETKVKMEQKEEKIFVIFPYKKVKAAPSPKIPDRQPISPLENDVTI